VGKSLNIRVFMITMAQNKNPIKEKAKEILNTVGNTYYKISEEIVKQNCGKYGVSCSEAYSAMQALKDVVDFAAAMSQIDVDMATVGELLNRIFGYIMRIEVESGVLYIVLDYDNSVKFRVAPVSEVKDVMELAERILSPHVAEAVAARAKSVAAILRAYGS